MPQAIFSFGCAPYLTKTHTGFRPRGLIDDKPTF
jgi:hypothetical protein